MIGFQQNLTELRHSAFRLAHSILKDREAAENLVQDVLLELWILKDETHTIPNLRLHILKVIRSKSLQSLESQMEMTAEERQQSVHVDRFTKASYAILHLPEIERSAMQLRDVEGLTFFEVSEIMDMTETEIRTHLANARKKVKEALKMKIDHE